MSVSILAVLTTAAGAAAQTLGEALVSSYLTNPRLEAQRAALRATDELVPQALSGWRPTLQGSASIDADDVDSSFGNTSLTSTSYNLRAEQEVYSGGETVASTRQAENLVRAQRATLLAVEQDVFLDAVAAYTAVQRDQAVVELARTNEERLERQLQATRDRFEVGEVTRTDVAQAEARLSGAMADRVGAEGSLQESRATFRAIIGLEPQQLEEVLPLPELPQSLVEALEQVPVNPNVLAAAQAIDAARAAINVARSALLPRVSVRGDLSYVDEPTTSIDYQRTASVAATVSVPFYQGGAEYSRVREAKQTLQQRVAELDDARRAVREEITFAFEGLTTASAQIRSIAEQVRANEIALEGVRQEALVGARTTLDVLDAEQELFQSEVDLVRALREQVVASYRLKAAIGELTVVQLGLPLEPYDVEEHYDAVRNRWFGLDVSTTE